MVLALFLRKPIGGRHRRCVPAVDVPDHLLGMHVTPADEQNHASVKTTSEQAQLIMGESAKVAYVDHNYMC